MKIGDIVQIKSRALLQEIYNTGLFDEKMLVTEITLLPGYTTASSQIVETVSETGSHRFPLEDLEVVDGNR